MTSFTNRLRPLGTALLVAVTLLTGSLVFGVAGAAAITPSADRERLWADHCMAYERTTTINTACVYGDKASKTVVALIGDSHMAHLFPAIERIAKARHWKLVVMVKVSCAFIDMRVRNLSLGREYYECATWNKKVIARLGVLKPYLTLVTNSRNAIHPVRSIDNTNTAKGKAVGREIAKVPGRVTVIVDSVYRGGYTTAIPKSVGLSNSLGTIEKVAIAYSGDSLINLTAATCPVWSCKVKVGTITKFRDVAHFTATFSRSILGAPGGTLDRALDARLP